MSINPDFFSFRKQGSQVSQFLDVDQLLNSNNLKKIKETYIGILGSITAYDPNHIETFSWIEDKFYTKIIELEEEIIKKTKSKNVLLSVLTIGIKPLILIIKKKSTENEINRIILIHEKFIRSIDQMRSRIIPKKLHPKLDALKELKESQLTDLDLELIRLKSIPRVSKSLDAVSAFLKKKDETLSKKFAVAFGRSLELREKLKDTHYIINHGQNIDLMIVNIISRKLKKEFEPDYYDSFEPLRHDTALRQIEKDLYTVTWYQNKKNTMNDHFFRNELISGDCVLESRTRQESALDFFSQSINVANRHGTLTLRLLSTIIEDYIPDQTIVKKLSEDLVTFIGRPRVGGNLYSICVPKDKFDESCYFSKPYGVFLENPELRKKLDKMQSGEYVEDAPQIRILTHKIDPSQGYHVILNSTLTDKELLEIDSEVSLCLQAALTGYRIKKSPKKFS